MKKRPEHAAAFGVCIYNKGYEASLELHKIYRMLSDDSLETGVEVRVVDESGEDYIYPAAFFSAIKPSAEVLKSLLRAS